MIHDTRARQIGFLGYNREQTGLIDVLVRCGCEVDWIKDNVSDLSKHDLVVSFGYRHILTPSVLSTAARPLVNLHISYLPYNRGAHPNFWSWVEDTPAGVSIHEIDEGVDTGPVIAQDRLEIDPAGLSFHDTYQMLFEMIEALFLHNIEAILTGHYRAVPQQEQGTLHRTRDLPEWMNDWNMLITDAVRKYNADR